MNSAISELERELLVLAAHPDLCHETRALIIAAGAVQSGVTDLADVVRRLTSPEFDGLNVPSAEGAAAGAELARLGGHHAGCCDSCAFRLGTLPNRCPQTVLDALECVATGAPFLCHQSGKPCEGWKAARSQSNP